ncbi:MAG: TIGR02444 family protein [Spongiibacteraceae bacterium]
MQINPFWDYSLITYARKGVERQLLALQQGSDADVNMLLCCCWLGEQGVLISTNQLRQLASACEQWRQHCLLPLRSVRVYLKNVESQREEMRNRLKALELEAECHQQQMMYQQLLAMGVVSESRETRSLVSSVDIVANLQAYWSVLGHAAAESQLLVELAAAVIE